MVDTKWERIVEVLRCVRCDAEEVRLCGKGVQCGRCGVVFPIEDDVLDVRGDAGDRAVTRAQRWFESALGSRGYAWARRTLSYAITGRSFDGEVEALLAHLPIPSHALVVDIACGPGNFTTAYARRNPETLFVGLDLSTAMLRCARAEAERSDLENVAWIAGDAQNLPFRRSSLLAVSSVGGFHMLPDLSKALSEIARTTKPGAAVAGGAFARIRSRLAPLQSALATPAGLNPIDFDALGHTLCELGFEDYGSDGRRPVFQYFWAKKCDPRPWSAQRKTN
ncbi:MAG: class I SAM-dependent methyltransferase [Deltaproteobacteria bacterium]|nr:class I SAM-dependent methyltransferase [Deltaproteobacteria bacterium]